MAVRAYATISGYTIEKTFECGQFDLMVDSGNPDGWTEIWRDCDLGTKDRRRLWPYASGLKGTVDLDITLPERARARKYFQASDDTFTDDLDMSTDFDTLPTDPCVWIEVWQNGKKIPCEGFTVDYGTLIITINSEWRVPGASYEVFVWAAASGSGGVAT